MSILDFLFPKRCVGCGRFGQYICNRCRSLIRTIAQNEAICPVCEKLAIGGATHPICRSRYVLDGLTSFFRYDGVAKRAIKAAKYRHVWDISREFASLVPLAQLQCIPDVYASHDALFVPIPLHMQRLRARGYNQAEMLGNHIAHALRNSVHTDILYRLHATSPQVAMKSKSARLANMNDVFAMRNKPVRGATIILFDDVFTSGATMRSAARALKRAGATRVWAVTMAR